MSVYLSLTQFLSYSSKVSTSAKINEIKRIKNAPNYEPSIDYWKQLRDEIKRLYENNIPIENLTSLSDRVSERKQKNYIRAISKFIAFTKAHEIEYFQTGKSSWKLTNELFVRTNPELGMLVDGQKYYIKNWYKKPEKDTKVTQRNIQSALTMMQISDCDFTTTESDKFGVLNLQNGKLIEARPLLSENILELEIDAKTLVDIWNRI